VNLKTKQEYDLVRACLKGQEVAFKTLFELFAPKMMMVCQRYAIDRHEAEDWMQEGFIKAFNNLGSFKFQGSFEGWVRKIMVNTALKHLNKASRRIEKVELDHFLDVGLNSQVLSNLAVEEILKVLEELPEGYRTIFNLNVVEGYNHKEISEKLGITESTSRSQLVKAKRALKNKLIKLLKLAG